jgi:hypothetical protein
MLEGMFHFSLYFILCELLGPQIILFCHFPIINFPPKPILMNQLTLYFTIFPMIILLSYRICILKNIEGKLFILIIFRLFLMQFVLTSY